MIVLKSYNHTYNLYKYYILHTINSALQFNMLYPITSDLQSPRNKSKNDFKYIAAKLISGMVVQLLCRPTIASELKGILHMAYLHRKVGVNKCK